MDFDFFLAFYLAAVTVVLDGPLITKFRKPPDSVRLPPPFETWTELISSGSKCSIPSSGMPKIHYTIHWRFFFFRTLLIQCTIIPVAKFGNIPWNIRRKQSSLVGLSLLQASNQSAENYKQQTLQIQMMRTSLINTAYLCKAAKNVPIQL